METKLFLRFISVITIAVLILVFSGSSFAQAEKGRAKGKKGGKGGSREPGGYVEGGVAGLDFMKKFDFDKDGKISHDEWEAIKPNTAYKDKHWPQYDLNRDGSITLDEVPQAQAKSSEAKPSYDISQIAFIVKFDKNEDGKVDNKEFTGQHFPVYDKNSDGFIEAHEAPQGETAY